MSLDPISLKTLILIVVFFAVAGAGVFAYERSKNSMDENLRRRYFSWYLIAPAILLPAYFGGIWFALFTTALALYAMREFWSVARVQELKPYVWTARAAGVAIIWTAIFASSSVPEPFATAIPYWQSALGKAPLFGPPLFYVLPVFVIMLVLTVPVWLGQYEGMLVKECVTIFGILYFGWFLGHLILLRNLPNGFGYLIFLCGAVVLNDVLAYTVGRLWGKHKMSPRISPKKTWEGGLGGVAGSLLAVAVFHYALPDLSWPASLIAGLLIAIASPLGDLIVSVIKRDMAVKDSGTLIPGHGGLLDRCDSLIFATPTFYYYLVFIRHCAF